MNSALYEGRIRHRRFQPIKHGFSYKLFMMYLDLDELDEVFKDIPLFSYNRPNLAWFRRADYLRPVDIPLKEAVYNLVEEHTGNRPGGPIRILTHLRYFGLCYNPVSFYYCFNESGTGLECLLAEVNNTPWNERHQYVMATESPEGSKHEFHLSKQFHVSPFLPMDMDYRWICSVPGDDLLVHIENYHNGTLYFDATLTLHYNPIKKKYMHRVLIKYPFMTLKVLRGIYWQAFRLRVKKAQFYPHA